MKVLMLGWELPPHHKGGMGVVCYNMCESLARSGIDIDFVLPYTADHSIDFMKIIPAHHQTAEEFVKFGNVYDADRFTEATKFSIVDKPLDLRQQHDMYAHNVAKLVLSKEFDVIHAHEWLTFRAGLAAKQQSGKPLVLHVHATQHDQSGGGHGNPIAREIEEEAFALADQIFAISEYTKNVIVKHYGIPADKIKVVHNTVEVMTEIDQSENVHSYLEKMKEHGYKVVTNVGRMTIQKGLTHLIDAAQRVIEVDPKILFLLAGGGDQKEELVRIVAQKRLSQNIIIEGWVSGKKRSDSYRIGDVFVMPSVSEPFGITPLEAIGYGVPVIISKQSGVAEVLHNAFKVDFWDTDKMADMIVALCRSESLNRTMWQNSYQEYLSQSWELSVKKMQSSYHEVHEAAT